MLDLSVVLVCRSDMLIVNLSYRVLLLMQTMQKTNKTRKSAKPEARGEKRDRTFA